MFLFCIFGVKFITLLNLLSSVSRSSPFGPAIHSSPMRESSPMVKILSKCPKLTAASLLKFESLCLSCGSAAISPIRGSFEAHLLRHHNGRLLWKANALHHQQISVSFQAIYLDIFQVFILSQLVVSLSFWLLNWFPCQEQAIDYLSCWILKTGLIPY